ncbi:MAG: sigma-70 family RNA polymerase sigma factor [Labilithrix sp.]|nr:sigma-70 family RNA polymerase sigma factor [Labilithrix sp.]MBX3212752.1 sigma-70 family RNA polymerase sigma factor [Labilithrix sp.]
MRALIGPPIATDSQDRELEAPPARARPDPGAIFREHGRYVYSALRSLGVQTADLEDVYQEVFMVVHRKLDSYEDRGSLRAWVYGICVRVALHARRRRGREREIEIDAFAEPIDPKTPAEHLSEQQGRRILYSILDKLDDDKRAVFVLYELEELTMPEIAQSLDCNVQTAYSRLRAARAAVAEAIARFRQQKELT